MQQDLHTERVRHAPADYESTHPEKTHHATAPPRRGPAHHGTSATHGPASSHGTSSPHEPADTPSADAPPGTRRSKQRFLGLDAARGFALIGMVAVHTLPAWNAEAYRATYSWQLFSGHAAALFAVLAGITLSFLTGGREPRRGRDLSRSQVSLATRAALLLLIGLTVNLAAAAFPVYNILPYYGLFFLLAIPFTALSVRWLITAATVMTVGGPLLMFALSPEVAYQADASIVDMVNDPVGVLGTLVFTGVFPAIPWMAFIFLGMALGRLPLGRLTVQAWTVVAGLVLAALAKGVSDLLVLRSGGWETMVAQTPGFTGEDVDEIMVFGSSVPLPNDTAWWLTISGPHTDTPFALALSAGMAMVAIGGFLLLARGLRRWLLPLTAVGTMTLTLYTAHLLFLASVDVTTGPWAWFFIQLAVAVLFAMVWHRVIGRGPLEGLVPPVSRSVGRALVPRGQAPRDQADAPEQADAQGQASREEAEQRR